MRPRSYKNLIACILAAAGLLTLLALPLLAQTAAAQSAEPVRVRSEVDKAVASTNDIITYRITFERRLDVPHFDLPEIGKDIAGFRVVDFGVDPARTEEGIEIVSRWYKLQADISGSYVLPALKVSYQDKDGSRQETATSEIFVEIQGTGGATDQTGKDGGKEAKDIRDIKPLIVPPMSWKWPLIVIALLCLSGMAGGFIYWWHRKTKNKPIVPKKPHEVAYERLAALKKSSLLSEGQYKLFHFTLSEIIRAYVEGRFGLAATDRTTEELRVQVQNLRELARDRQNDFINILLQTDLYKFTDTVASEAVSLALVDAAENFVRQTRPVEVKTRPAQSNSGDEQIEESVL